MVVDQLLIGSELETLLQRITAIATDDAEIKALLGNAFAASSAYHEAWIAKSSRKR